jgi:hypothetical protein
MALYPIIIKWPRLTYYRRIVTCPPITMAARSEAWAVSPLKHWVRGFESHLRHGCLLWGFILCLCCSLCRYLSCDGLIPVQGVLPTVYRLRNWKAVTVQRAVEPYIDSNMSWVMLIDYTNLLNNFSTNITPYDFAGLKYPNHFMSPYMICWYWFYSYVIGKESCLCTSLYAIRRRRMEKWRYSSAILCLSTILS